MPGTKAAPKIDGANEQGISGFSFSLVFAHMKKLGKMLKGSPSLSATFGDNCLTYAAVLS